MLVELSKMKAKMRWEAVGIMIRCMRGEWDMWEWKHKKQRVRTPDIITKEAEDIKWSRKVDRNMPYIEKRVQTM